MQILTVHNRYQICGGEDQSRESEDAVLRSRGHVVAEYCRENDAIPKLFARQMAYGLRAIWSNSDYCALRRVLRERRPDICDIHNFFPLISPAVYYAARAEGVPVVQTLHNYRLLCPNGLFFREHKPCERCLGKPFAWPGVIGGCYRESWPASAAVATMVGIHRGMGTWDKMVDVYVALTEFARQKFIAGGLPAEKIVVKPNFVVDPGVGAGEGDYALYVGRISAEKGVRVMLEAWRKVSSIALKIVGDGPLAEGLKSEYEGLAGVEWLGLRPLSEVYRLLAGARMLVFPSECYEGLPRTPIEAFAVGTPVVASNLGAMSTVLKHRSTGLHFNAGSVDDLAAKLDWAWSHELEWAAMRRAARAEYELKYTAERNYEMMINIYERALRSAAVRNQKK